MSEKLDLLIYSNLDSRYIWFRRLINVCLVLFSILSTFYGLQIFFGAYETNGCKLNKWSIGWASGFLTLSLWLLTEGIRLRIKYPEIPNLTSMFYVRVKTCLTLLPLLYFVFFFFDAIMVIPVLNNWCMTQLVFEMISFVLSILFSVLPALIGLLYLLYKFCCT